MLNPPPPKAFFFPPAQNTAGSIAIVALQVSLPIAAECERDSVEDEYGERKKKGGGVRVGFVFCHHEHLY